MFRFGFGEAKSVQEGNFGAEKNVCNWIPASKVEVPLLEVERTYSPDDYTECAISPTCKFKLIRSDRALSELRSEGCPTIVEAELQHSDLIPAKYEGGLKIWECSYDLGQYIFDTNIELDGKHVLDLGCGTGVIGLVALLKNSTVHFQDYNVEVIKTLTVRNIFLNFDDWQAVLARCEFYSGDWASFVRLSSLADKKYDVIFTSETIYNPENHRKLYAVFKEKLRRDGGVGYIAGKTHYFGVGGGIRQFQCLVEEDDLFEVEVAWKSREGLQREILKLTWKPGQ
ncbi:hypothetical protein KM043_016384 [Ampulex compressa]|nr:hypothetical protein KM043_016384 [Ampulex compressa]